MKKYFTKVFQLKDHYIINTDPVMERRDAVRIVEKFRECVLNIPEAELCTLPPTSAFKNGREKAQLKTEH